MKTLVERLRDPWRCDVTGNPYGTDTRMIGKPCLCQGCRAADRIEKLEAALWDAEMNLDPEHETKWYAAYKDLLADIRNRAAPTPSPLPQQP